MAGATNVRQTNVVSGYLRIALADAVSRLEPSYAPCRCAVFMGCALGARDLVLSELRQSQLHLGGVGEQSAVDRFCRNFHTSSKSLAHCCVAHRRKGCFSRDRSRPSISQRNLLCVHRGQFLWAKGVCRPG